MAHEKVPKPDTKNIDVSEGPSIESLLSGLKSWIDQKAIEAEHDVLERAALPEGPAAEVLARVGEEAKNLVTQRLVEGASVQETKPSHGPEKNRAKLTAARPTSESTNPASSSGAKVAVEGRDAVFNNPWNKSVEPVERYLKQHVHDAASIEILEWGQVEVTREGFQARCVYKSKNVLGKMTTQSRLFVLDHSGKVVDVRD